MKKYIVLALILVISVTSCPGDNDKDSNTLEPPSQNEKKFWAQDFTNDTYYQIDAKWLAYNSLCEIWVEKGVNVTTAQAQTVASTYKDNIYVKMMDAFGWKMEIDGLGLRDTMQWANHLGSKDGRLKILLLDIKDGFTGTGGFIAGYFGPVNFISDSQALPLGHRSNECDMIYMDINPAAVGSEVFYSTLAHEMQHLMNFVTSYLYVTNGTKNDYSDEWIDEGLSESAEWIYSGKVSQSRVDWYNADLTENIRKGSNFYLWGKYDNHPNAALDDYATVNLFFQWLRLNYSKSVYYSIMMSEYYDYRAITNAINPLPQWGELFEAWHAANFIQHPSNLYGYKNDSVLRTVKARYLNTTDTTVQLNPGEAVYTYSAVERSKPVNSGFIRYAGLGMQGIDNINVPAGLALLTFNSDTATEEYMAISGTITGEASPSLNIQPVNQDTLTSFEIYRIDARDLLRRNGFNSDIPEIRHLGGLNE